MLGGGARGDCLPLPCLLVVLGRREGAGRLGQAEACGAAVLVVRSVAVRRKTGVQSGGGGGGGGRGGASRVVGGTTRGGGGGIRPDRETERERRRERERGRGREERTIKSGQKQRKTTDTST